MRYQNLTQNSTFPYPDNNIAPEKKGRDFCMQYAKAAYWDWSYSTVKGMFSNNGGDYAKHRMYALGKQPVTPYKTWLGVDSATNNTWLSVDWTIRPIVSGYRDKSISRLMRNNYGIVCTPIDMLAKTEQTQYYSDMKAKLAVREIMLQQNPEMASHPLITMQSGEPMDLEELEMRVELGEQFNRSKDAEMAIELGFYENDYNQFRRSIYEDLFDYGVAGKKDWLGSDNKAKFRRVNPELVVTSVCRKSDFSDMVHAGEVIDVSLIELATLTDDEGNKMFTEEELQEFAGSICGKFGNPRALGNTIGYIRPYDKFKCQVLDIEFYTYNRYAYNDTKDEYGNSDFRKGASGRGKNSPKYKRKTIQYVYKCKWIVGTDKCYDWGMCYDQKRSVDTKKKAATRLSYTFFAYNFFEMRAQSFMERLIPYLDDYQLTMLKIQNFKNRAVPSGWWINLDMLENVALSKGGKNMQPKELLQMFFETGVLVGRSLQANGEPFLGNIQPVIPIENTAASELQMFYQDIVSIITTIERMVGYNDITNGNPNPKTLVPGYEMAKESTNDALYPMAFAEEMISLKLAEDVLCRMQQGIRKGGVSGYAPALNTNILRFIELSPDLGLRDYGIELEKKTTDDQKAWLMQNMQEDIRNGYLSTADAVTLVNTHNAKQAQSIWSLKVKKAKEKMQQNELQKMKMQSDGNAQVAAASEQGKQQTMAMEWNFKLQSEQMKLQASLKEKEMELQAAVQMKMLDMQMKDKINTDLADAKRDVADITADAKVASSAIDHNAKLQATHLAGNKAIEKQEIANQRPQSQSKNK